MYIPYALSYKEPVLTKPRVLFRHQFPYKQLAGRTMELADSLPVPYVVTERGKHRRMGVVEGSIVMVLC